jgi:hypothetical protein
VEFGSASLTDLVYEHLQSLEVDVAVATVALVLSETVGAEEPNRGRAGVTQRYSRLVSEVWVISTGTFLRRIGDSQDGMAVTVEVRVKITTFMNVMSFMVVVAQVYY